MRWASAISHESRLELALAELCERLLPQLEGASPDLALVFLSPQFRSEQEALPGLLRERLQPAALLGCTAAGVIGGGEEVELPQTAVSLTIASLPGVEIQRFHLDSDQLPDLDRGPGRWVEALGVAQAPSPQFLLLADPYTFDPQDLLLGLDFAYPDSTKLGGLASGGRGHVLYLDDKVYHSGVAGLALQGNVVIDPVVAQGCRPVGAVHEITSCRDNLLVELDGRPPAEILASLYTALTEEQQDLFGAALQLGVAPSSLLASGPDEPGFVMRNIAGLDRHEGILKVFAQLRTGQRVQFHLRDRSAASEDLQAHLNRYRPDPDAPPEGALLFSCAGRGEHLFGRPNHDSDTFRELVGDLPLGGFFCGGEIGPVEDTTYLHTYTSAFGIIRPQA